MPPTPERRYFTAEVRVEEGDDGSKRLAGCAPRGIVRVRVLRVLLLKKFHPTAALLVGHLLGHAAGLLLHLLAQLLVLFGLLGAFGEFAQRAGRHLLEHLHHLLERFGIDGGFALVVRA